jgi:hypothetical protein
MQRSWEATTVLSSIPFCPYNGRRVSLRYLPAAARYMTQEKGKVEKGAIHYIRHNFWPLRTFRDLSDLQAQANQWRDQVANVRVHSTTGQQSMQRF